MKDDDISRLFYDENGRFIPLTSILGNTDGNIAYLRNTFMEAERELFKKLLSDPFICAFFLELEDRTDDELIEFATSIQNKLENGELETNTEIKKMKTMSPRERDNFHLQKLVRAEGYLTLLLAAIRDKADFFDAVRLQLLKMDGDSKVFNIKEKEKYKVKIG